MIKVNEERVDGVTEGAVIPVDKLPAYVRDGVAEMAKDAMNRRTGWGFHFSRGFISRGEIAKERALISGSLSVNEARKRYSLEIVLWVSFGCFIVGTVLGALLFTYLPQLAKFLGDL